jgi:hypothetical protein
MERKFEEDDKGRAELFKLQISKYARDNAAKFNRDVVFVSVPLNNEDPEDQPYNEFSQDVWLHGSQKVRGFHVPAN